MADDDEQNAPPIDLNYQRKRTFGPRPMSKTAVVSLVLCILEVPYLCGGAYILNELLREQMRIKIPAAVLNASIFVLPSAAIICGVLASFLIPRNPDKPKGKVLARIGIFGGLLWLIIGYLMYQIHFGNTG